MLYSHDFYFDSNFNNSAFSILLLNIFIYLISTIGIFLIFFFFNLDNFVSLNKIKIFSSSYFFYMSVILILLSMLGMPPMAGFCGKFLMAIFMNLQSNFFFFFFFIVLNLFMIYFYLQNFRYLIKKTSSIDLSLIHTSFKITEKNYLILVLILFFLFFFIFFFNDFLLIFSSFLFF